MREGNAPGYNHTVFAYAVKYMHNTVWFTEGTSWMYVMHWRSCKHNAVIALPFKFILLSGDNLHNCIFGATSYIGVVLYTDKYKSNIHSLSAQFCVSTNIWGKYTSVELLYAPLCSPASYTFSPNASAKSWPLGGKQAGDSRSEQNGCCKLQEARFRG